MPTYEFHCKKCKKNFEEFRSFKDFVEITTCPTCKKETATLVLGMPFINIRLATSEIRELGHLAARNSEVFSEDQKTMLTEKHKTKKDDAPRDLPSGIKRANPKRKYSKETMKRLRKIGKMDTAQKETYIKTGIMPNAE